MQSCNTHPVRLHQVEYDHAERQIVFSMRSWRLCKRTYRYPVSVCDITRLFCKVERALPTFFQPQTLLVGNAHPTTHHRKILCDKSVWNGFGPQGDPEGVKYRDVFHQFKSLRNHLAPW